MGLTMTKADHSVADRLHGAALQLFLQHGYSATSLQMIADSLGVTKAAIYYHYRTKDDLLEALMVPPAQDLGRLLDGIENSTARGRGRQFIELYVDFLLDHRLVVALGSKDATVHTNERVRQISEDIRNRIRSLLAGERMTLDGAVQFAAALGALQAVVASFLDTDSAVLRPLMIDIAGRLLRPRRTAHGTGPAADRAHVAPGGRQA